MPYLTTGNGGVWTNKIGVIPVSDLTNFQQLGWYPPVLSHSHWQLPIFIWFIEKYDLHHGTLLNCKRVNTVNWPTSPSRPDARSRAGSLRVRVVASRRIGRGWPRCYGDFLRIDDIFWEYIYIYSGLWWDIPNYLATIWYVGVSKHENFLGEKDDKQSNFEGILLERNNDIWFLHVFTPWNDVWGFLQILWVHDGSDYELQYNVEPYPYELPSKSFTSE